jgi:hypothetical protein
MKREDSATCSQPFGDDLRNMILEIAWATFLSIGWKSKLKFWPYVAIAVCVLRLLYLILTSNP